MIRRDYNAKMVPNTVGWMGHFYVFKTRYRNNEIEAKIPEGKGLGVYKYSSIIILQKTTPILMNTYKGVNPRNAKIKFGEGTGMHWYYYKYEFWITNELHYKSSDIKHLIDEILVKEKEKVKKARRKTEEEKKWHRTHMSGGDCPMCGNSMFPLKRELPFEDECNKCKYSFTFVYKKINLGHTQYEDGIKPTRPKPPRAKSTGREPIPQDLMDAVWNRDGGHCVRCNSEQDLEYDHMIPLSKGGSNSYKNLQLLCRKCNRENSDNIG